LKTRSEGKTKQNVWSAWRYNDDVNTNITSNSEKWKGVWTGKACRKGNERRKENKQKDEEGLLSSSPGPP
jgi:hypothetical protein